MSQTINQQQFCPDLDRLHIPATQCETFPFIHRLDIYQLLGDNGGLAGRLESEF